MSSQFDIREDEATFLLAFLDRIESVMEQSIDRLGTWRCIVLLSSLLAVALHEIFGPTVSLEEISKYAKKFHLEMEDRGRLIVVERVLRTGAGYPDSLSGLSEDEVLGVTVMVLRSTFRALEDGSPTHAEFAERAVRLATEGIIVGR